MRNPSRIKITADLWGRQAVQEALRAQDMCAVFRLVRKYSGASQTDIGVLVGMSQPEVSAIERGRRRVTEQHVFRRIADGLGVPPGLLGLAVNTGEVDAGGVAGSAAGHWPGGPVAAMPRIPAQRGGCMEWLVPAWMPESAQHGSDPDQCPDQYIEIPGLGRVNRRHFLRVLAVAAASADVLTAGQAIPPWQLLAQTLDRRGSADRAVIGEFESVTDLLRTLHPRLSAQSLLPLVRQHLDSLTSLLAECRNPTQEQCLASNAGEVAVMAGLLSFFDSRDGSAARAYYEVGLKAADMAGDDALAAHALTSLSGLALYNARDREALTLAQQARSRVRGGVGPATRSFLAVVEAEGHAQAGDALPCERALDEAEKWMAEPAAGKDPGWVSFFDTSRLDSYRGACYLRLGKLKEAERALRRALSRFTSSSVKYRCITLADLARALVKSKRIEEGCGQANEALRIADELNYSAGFERIRELLREITPSTAGEPTVVALVDQMRARGQLASP